MQRAQSSAHTSVSGTSTQRLHVPIQKGRCVFATYLGQSSNLGKRQQLQDRRLLSLHVHCCCPHGVDDGPHRQSWLSKFVAPLLESRLACWSRVEQVPQAATAGPPPPLPCASRDGSSMVAITAMMPAFWSDITSNVIFMSGFLGWFIAQFAKIFTNYYKKGKWDFTMLIASGGMPSSHSALCMSVTTAMGMTHGFGSSLFAMALCFSLIVMYDAAGVRRHAGTQAEVVNLIVNELLKGHAISQRKLKEVLGHTPLQVMMGALVGVVTGVLYPLKCSGYMSMAAA